MTNKEFIERLKNADLIYETDENGNVITTKSVAEIFKNNFKHLEKDLEILNILKHLIEIIYNNSTDGKSIYNIRIKPLHMIDDKILLEIKEWLDNDK